MFQLILQQPASWCSNWYCSNLTVDVPTDTVAAWQLMFQLIQWQPDSWCSNWYSGSLTVDMPRSLTADVYWLFFNSVIQPKVSLAVDIVATLCLHVSGLFPSLTGGSHCTCAAEFTKVSSQSFCLGAVLDWASRTSDEVMSLCNSCAIPVCNRVWPKSLHFLLGQSTGLSI